MNDLLSVAASSPPTPEPLPEPVNTQERLSCVDAVRGLAVLGILMMNIPIFGIPPAYAANPRFPEGSSYLNEVFWFANYLLFEGKMRCLFSILFGAGVILMTSRAERKGAQAHAADVYYRRTIWLLVIGLFHGFFLWEGDILYWYGTLGLLLYPFRKLSGLALFGFGLLFASGLVLQGIYQDHQHHTLEVQARQAEQALDAGERLTAEQTAARTQWQEYERRQRPPTSEEIEKKIKQYQGTYLDVFKHRAKHLLATQAQVLYHYGLTDVLPMMLIGMGLMQLGILTGSRSVRFYLLFTLIAYGIGIPLSAYEASVLVESNYQRHAHLISFHLTYNAERISVALGHLGALILLY